MAHDIFISYSHKDKTTADAICSVMESNGLRCWYAPRDIAPGDQWAGAIIKALSVSKVMILIFTDFSNVSKQVLREVNNAVSYGVTIVPFRLTQNEPTDEMKYYLATLHWLDAMDTPLKESINLLYLHVSTFLQNQPNVPVITPAIQESVDAGNKIPFKKILFIAVPVVAVLTVAVILGSIIANRSSPPSDSGDIPSLADDSGTDSTLATTGTTDGNTNSGTTGGKTDSGKDSGNSNTASIRNDSDDSPGAENYLYTIAGNKVTLDKYFGENETMVAVPEKIDGCPVTKIGEGCFEDQTAIEQVILPETITTIDYRSFYGCKALCEINFPEALNNTGGWAFAYCGFTEAVFPEGFMRLGYGTFYGCSNLETVVLSQNVTHIYEDTFRSCRRLSSVTIPSQDIDINVKAFDDGTGVTILGAEGSYTETYCKAMSLTFKIYEP